MSVKVVTWPLENRHFKVSHCSIWPKKLMLCPETVSELTYATSYPISYLNGHFHGFAGDVINKL